MQPNDRKDAPQCCEFRPGGRGLMQNNGRREARYLACGRPTPDHAGSPVMLPRESDCTMRRDGSSAAPAQPQQPVDERGRLHGASELLIGVDWRIAASGRMVLSSNKRGQRWRKRYESHSRLRRRDKSADLRRAHVVGWIDVCCNGVGERAGAARRNLNSFNVETAICPSPDADRSL